MIAYKAMNRNLTCRGFQYEIGKIYKHDGEIGLYKSGFHFCRNPVNCFSHYDWDNKKNVLAEVEVTGDIKGCAEEAEVTNEIKIKRILEWHEVQNICNSGNKNSGNSNSGDCNSGHWNSGNSNSGHWNSGNSNSGHWNSGNSNSGDWNSGHRNSGHWNSGHRNSGHWNSGDWNSGDWNSGDWNSCNKESGYFNSKKTKYVRVFNKKCLLKDWENADKPDFIFFNLTEWIYEDDMTEEEKKENTEYKTIGGYLKKYTYQDAFYASWKKAHKADKVKIFNLPNFDIDVFCEISGIPKKELTELQK